MTNKNHIQKKKLEQKHSKKEKTILTIIFITLVVVVGVILFKTTMTQLNTDAYSLANCLNSKNIKMFGSETCGACKYQKELFGDAFSKIDFIDCGYEPDLCKENDITLYPTWIINNNQIHGAQSLDKLARISGCNLEE